MATALTLGGVGCDDDDIQVVQGRDEGVIETDGEAPRAQCADGLDNDGDGLTDLSDPGCTGPLDDDEFNALPQCSNGEDDDDDGQVDFPSDLGCGSALDDDESDDPVPPACSNGLDDDTDGFIDFPQDPGCGSLQDDDESDDAGPMLPQCGNGIDDDHDGFVDLADPGCVSGADPRETDPEIMPVCFNGQDDDGDGIIDFPNDPGCASAGDDTEDNGARPPMCGNGLDDDHDGEIDYPFDPGCGGVGDGDETDPPVHPGCSDGLDNDRDGLTDFPDDRGCESAADGSEVGSCGDVYEPAELTAGRIFRGDSRRGLFESQGSCGGVGAPEVVFVYRVDAPIEALRIHTMHEENMLESVIYVRRGCLDAGTEVACAREPVDDGVAGNELFLPNPTPGDYYIFLDGAFGRGGDYVIQVEEVPLAACLNGVDDDADGRVDYPLDPGCERPDDRTEEDPETLPECADDEDNDGDALIDFPLDIGCTSAGDDDEVDLCGQGVRMGVYPVGEPFMIDDTSRGGTNSFAGGCGGAGAVEKVYVYNNPHNARLTFSVAHEETIENTLIYVRGECLSGASELGCDGGDVEDGNRGSLTLDRVPPGELFIFVDHRFGLGGSIKLSVGVERLPPGCDDRVDNDEDGYVDGEDPGCDARDDEDERDPVGGALAACNNGLDDDEDGVTDFPLDPGCEARGDDDEADPAVSPACSNGQDDDDDGLTDYPLDVGCASAGDDNELDERVRPGCNNRFDDDQDGLADYPNDPGCAARGDLSEVDDARPTACANGEDDDRDGLVDFPFDPGCAAAGDPDERDLEVAPVCSNGLDDDEDGIVDFPRDPGCVFASDDDEADPGFAPQCANGMDDDQNGRVDWPDDAGCRFAGDSREVTDGPVLARCADGVDNDDDGSVDLTDLGCVNAQDNDENDPEVVPICADGADNDEDGLIDWPEDDGCAGQGDVCEQAGFGFCGGICVDLTENAVHCGRCDRACGAGVACNAGRCGELRPVVLQCGRSDRDLNEFILGDLAEANVVLRAGCVPDDDTQAVLLTRNGINEFNAQVAAYTDYVEGGGLLITEYRISHLVYNALFGTALPMGGAVGGCQGNVQPVVQFSPDATFWQDNIFQPLPMGSSGCGADIDHIPGLIPLGGWSPTQVSLGYLNLGGGRVWMVEANWQDRDAGFTDGSRELMAYMISGNGATVHRAICADGRDNDEDGWIDAEDPGCTERADDDETDPEVPPACANGLDDDGDGALDYPQDPGCTFAGDDDETNPAVVPACNNGLDDDGDGQPDWPFDPGCISRADLNEGDPERAPRCANGRDDDGDGLVDWPGDPGCAYAADPDEAEVGLPPACGNGLDDDRDGIVDWPFDLGCYAASDTDERDPAQEDLPRCSNREDDDGDGLTDFPADPGCASAGDVRELDPADASVCSNGVDDDGDGRTDYPDDRGCRFAGDDDEVDPFNPPARCGDGVDNDGDGLVDLQDIGCVNRDDDDEVDQAEVPLCGNEIDDDEDGLVDWPEDPGCQARGDEGEAQACRAEVDTPLIEANGTVAGRTAEGEPDLYRSQCGGRDAPDAVFRYVLAERADLVISADNPGTNFPVVLSVSRDCEEPLASLACAGDFRNPAPSITLRDADPGEYYITVDGGGPERWVGTEAPIAMPVDPQNFVARHDLNEQSWSDGGSDAFDGYGRIAVAFAGASVQLNVAEGERANGVGGYGFHYVSEWAHDNVWRVRLMPDIDNDERTVTITVTGNLGSDGSTVSAIRQTLFQGRQVAWLNTSDSFAAPRDPPVIHLLLPSDPEQLGAVSYAVQGDNPTLTAREITLPATLFIGLSYGDNNAVAAAMMQSVEIQAGGGGADAPRFGDFELSVTER